jgi:SAM-dependent methyltransferase
VTRVAALDRALVLVLFRIGRGADRAARVSRYLAGGVLRLADLRAGIRAGWQGHYERERPNTAGLMTWEQELADRFIPHGANVLVVGAGSGRDLVALAERGCRVTGIEPSSGALALARRTLADRRLTAALVEGFFEDAAIGGAFDAVLFSYYCYSCVPESRRRIAALAKAAALLKPGGHVIVSHANQAAPGPVLIALARVMGALSRSDWRMEPGDRLWDNGGGRPSYSYSHAFGPGEVEREAAAAGLRCVFALPTEDGQAFVLDRV